MCYRWRNLVRWREGEESCFEFFFECFGFRDEDGFFDMGVDAEVLFEGLELGEEDAVERLIGVGWFVEPDRLADIFQLVLGVVVFAEEAVDGVLDACEHEAGKTFGRLGGFLEEANIGKQAGLFRMNVFGEVLYIV